MSSSIASSRPRRRAAVKMLRPPINRSRRSSGSGGSYSSASAGLLGQGGANVLRVGGAQGVASGEVGLTSCSIYDCVNALQEDETMTGDSRSVCSFVCWFVCSFVCWFVCVGFRSFLFSSTSSSSSLSLFLSLFSFLSLTPPSYFTISVALIIDTNARARFAVVRRGTLRASFGSPPSLLFSPFT